MLLRFDPDRRFTCAQCGRCCRRGRVALTRAEAERYRATGVERLYLQEPGLPPVAAFEDQDGATVIRPRTDGSCGFLTPDNRCAIHAELGAQAKPLTCRLFPFAVHPLDGETVITASASCPAVAGQSGAPLGEQAAELRRLAKAWTDAHPEPARRVVLHGRRVLDPPTLQLLRQRLEELLLRPDGDLRANVGLVGQRLADLTRHRVAKLDDDAFRDYATLTLRHAVTAARTPLPAPGAAAARLVRAVLAAALATRERFAHPERGFAARTVATARVMAHLHGLAPAAAGFDLRRARAVRVDLAEPALAALASAWMLSTVRTLGAGPGTVLEQASLSTAVLEAAFLLAGDVAARRGGASVTADDLREALPDADVLGASGTLARGLQAAVAGPEVLFRLAGRGPDPLPRP